ncbi:Ig-like domain-containing protein [Flagellimonas profundi]|uniref:Ig-like domain-containing protein n=1 Tax=Flagellimonas profundi TaxID=2915620 RepID=A0ABS3FK15_9FLAO|nr:Ig-like domain-containing protein [Allomuricauda profundi]MBO0343476.1 Ig-like domain-containing protein [Allomuricauda profundi]
MKIKFKIKNKRTLLLGLMILTLMGCSEDDGVSMDTLRVISVKLNDSPLMENQQDVALESSFEIVFSAAVAPNALEKSMHVIAGTEDVPFTLQYLNQSTKIIATFDGLSENTMYTVNVDSGKIGSEGKMLAETVSYTFTTVANDLNAKSPCSSATADCMQQLDLKDNTDATLTFDMYSNYDFIDDSDFVWDFIDKVVVVVHGANRDADNYFEYMTSSLQSMDLEETTLVIAPYFQDNSSAPANGLVWNDSRWREGTNADNNNIELSSFAVLDSLVNRFTDQQRFPNLKNVFIAGHSSGAAFTQHYALANKVQESAAGVDFQYIVANNQYFYYPDGQRYNEETGTFYEPMDCEGYDYWPYGYEFAPPYLDGIDAATLTQQQVARNTIYLLGGNDTLTTGTLNTSDCQATLIGSNRLKRGKNMYLYMETFYPTENNHREIIVPNVGHDGNGMFNSSEFKQFILEFE